jgi:UDP-2,3-diacylglucosamine hydrolase
MIKLQHSKFNTLSDLHIKHDDSDEANFLIEFINSSIDQNVEAIFFLGDIFDLLVGSDLKLTQIYSRVFKSLKLAVERDISLYFLEGNHDFHLEILFQKYFPRSFGHNFFYFKHQVENVYNGDRILLCHGDDIEIDNINYQLYKEFIRSNYMKFIANYVLNSSIIKRIGDSASKRSRRYSESYDQDFVRNKFRISAQRQFLEGYTTIIAGHSHVKDEYLNQNGNRYYNNGYAPFYKNYINYNEGTITFKKISESDLA